MDFQQILAMAVQQGGGASAPAAPSNITDESGNQITDESANKVTTG